ncbi:hypothetical protein ABK040_007744 [Willaertia magna]
MKASNSKEETNNKQQETMKEPVTNSCGLEQEDEDDTVYKNEERQKQQTEKCNFIWPTITTHETDDYNDDDNKRSAPFEPQRNDRLKKKKKEEVNKIKNPFFDVEEHYRHMDKVIEEKKRTGFRWPSEMKENSTSTSQLDNDKRRKE